MLTRGFESETNNVTGVLFYTLTQFYYVNRMAWQWAETLVEIRGTLADIRELPNRGADTISPNINLTGLYV